jgi:hypothetical protein
VPARRPKSGKSSPGEHLVPVSPPVREIARRPGHADAAAVRAAGPDLPDKRYNTLWRSDRGRGSGLVLRKAFGSFPSVHEYQTLDPLSEFNSQLVPLTSSIATAMTLFWKRSSVNSYLALDPVILQAAPLPPLRRSAIRSLRSVCVRPMRRGWRPSNSRASLARRRGGTRGPDAGSARVHKRKSCRPVEHG